MRVIRYANSLNFFDKGKNIEIYSAAAFYITLRFIKVYPIIYIGSLFTHWFQWQNEH
jgi:hypothetical protein